jgi:peptidoglycan/LPS O-acetylase OafA/YrhL
LVAGAAFKEKIGAIPFITRKLSTLGDSSYSLYLLHILLIDLALVLLHWMLPVYNAYGAALSVPLIILCIGVAYIMYNGIEFRLVRSLQMAMKHKRVYFQSNG